MEEKQKIGIVADEGGDLPKELIEKYKISIVPFRVDLGEMKDIPGNIYQKIREAEKRGLKSFIKTSQPSPGDFLNAFKEKLKNFEKLICVTITSKHSGTFNSAIQAKNLLKGKVEVLDSLSVSGGEGLIILKAAKLIEKGLKMKEILENLKKSVLNTHLIAILEDPKWAEASGRIPKLLALGLKGAKKLGFFTLLTFKNGRIFPALKKRKKDMAETLFEEFEKKISKKEKIKVAITHADNEIGAKKLKSLIENLRNCEISFVNIIGNVLGGLAGPGALALAWQTC